MDRTLSLLSVFAILVFGCISSEAPKIGRYGSEHSHADFKVYINNAAIDFAQASYQGGHSGNESEEAECGNETQLAHLDNGDGDVVHKHATGVTWGYFFSELSMNLTDNCLVLDNETAFCNSNGARWRFFVNGSETGQLKDVEIRDLGRVLLTYNATDEQIRQQLASVTSKSAGESKGEVCRITANKT